MYIILAGCAQQGASSPLAATFDIGSQIDIVDMAGVATGSVVTFTTPLAALDFTAIASGGTGSYTFSWSVSKTFESSDTGSRFSVGSVGTTNQFRYNTLQINGARGANGGDNFEAEFLVSCQVGDGVSTVTIQTPAQVMAPSL